PRDLITFPTRRSSDLQSYQQVLEADFSALNKPGEYRLYVQGLGTSFPFFIGDEVAGAFARTSALGIYHQRCGMANELPFTRFTQDRKSTRLNSSHQLN